MMEYICQRPFFYNETITRWNRHHVTLIVTMHQHALPLPKKDEMKMQFTKQLFTFKAEVLFPLSDAHDRFVLAPCIRNELHDHDNNRA